VDVAELWAKDGYRTARAVFLEEEPRISDWRTHVQEGPVVVLPHFLAGGLHGSEDVPELLGISGSEEGWYESEKGEVGYGEPLGRPEEVEEMIIELVAAKA
jgi:sirohydrochlorin ferrochelatase